jgi:hypothetical protein
MTFLATKPKLKINRLPREMSGPAPYALNAAQDESGKMPSAILHKDLRFKDGPAEIAAFASQIQMTFKEQKRQLELLKQLIRSH